MANTYNKFKKFIITPFIKTIGATQTVNSQSISVQRVDNSGNIVEATGTVVITDGGSGYAKGCRYTKTNAASGTAGLYQNIGTSSSCLFVLLTTGAGVLATQSETITCVAGVGTLTYVPLTVQNIWVNGLNATTTGAFTIIPNAVVPLTTKNVALNNTTGVLTFKSSDSVSQAFVTYVRTS